MNQMWRLVEHARPGSSLHICVEDNALRSGYSENIIRIHTCNLLCLPDCLAGHGCWVHIIA